jgi:hypothetical protein
MDAMRGKFFRSSLRTIGRRKNEKRSARTNGIRSIFPRISIATKTAIHITVIRGFKRGLRVVDFMTSII